MGLLEAFRIVKEYEVKFWLQRDVRSICPDLFILLHDCEVVFELDLVLVVCPSLEFARHILSECLAQALAFSVWIIGKKQVRIYWRGCLKPCSLVVLDILRFSENKKRKNMTNSNQRLLEASYPEILLFMYEQASQGKLICITGMYSDQCYHMGTFCTPQRGKLADHSLWTTYNFGWAWRESLKEKEGMLTLLNNEFYIPKLEYNLLRPDGSLCRYYNMDYYLARNYFDGRGEPVRISVCDPNTWLVIRPAPEAV